MEQQETTELYLDGSSSENELKHYGTPRHSGRYPWGSGDSPYQHSGDFLSRVDELKSQGMNETEIAEALGYSTTEMRSYISLAKSERRNLLVAQAKSLKEDGLSNVEIADKMGLKGESSVRSLLNADSEARMKIAEKTANTLRDLVDERGMIDVGAGTERQLGISKEKMNQSLEILKAEGYEVYGRRIEQQTNVGKFTTLKILCPPGTKMSETYDESKINYLNDIVSDDGGETTRPSFQYPESMKSERLAIRYAEEGGSDKDGLVEIRRGVKDLSLGEANYAQVRILVDGTHYIKGMAVYSDNLPDGVDVLFNTNKVKGTPVKKVLKEIKDDQDNPFGSNIKENGGQSYYIGDDGEKHLSLINKRADEGDWGEWSKELSSQFLSKQSITLINKQLKLAESYKQDEFDEIMSLTNPTVKRSMLLSFADECDSAAIELKAASLPGTVYKVILPVTSLKDNECYNPQLKDGTQVALIRYPHGGTFEIPILTVNNRNKEAIDILTTTPADAIGINSNVAARLSGADFDGDTVQVIPIRQGSKITSTPALKGLEGFDPKLNYGPDEVKIINGVEHYYRGGNEYRPMKESNKQLQMGIVSNLITDMTLQGATDEEKARAVRHSMVVIDAPKHNLDYKQSEIENNIADLKNKYQLHYDPFTDSEHKGASTLISMAGSELNKIPERKEGGYFVKDTDKSVRLYDKENNLFVDESTGEIFKRNQIKILPFDPNTGEKVYHETGRTYKTVTYKTSSGKNKTVSVIEQNGNMYYKGEDGRYVQITNEKVKENLATQSSTKMAEVKDARILSSGTVQENAYADYANKMKSLANMARKESYVVEDIPYSPSAKIVYSKEAESLDYKLNQALLNAPKERQAQTIAATNIKAKKQADPAMSSEHEAKLRQQELTKARAMVGAQRREVQITEKEWEAIQAGAISKTKLKQIIDNSDSKILRELAMPRERTTLSDAKINRIKSMANAGYTTAEIAESLGVSASTITNYLKG